MKSFCYLLTLTISCFFLSGILLAARLNNVPQQLIQPNGDTLRCFASGDEYHNWLHDQNNYTIIQDPVTGYYTYAIKKNGILSVSNYIAGKVDPATVGLIKGINIAPDQMSKKRQRFLNMTPSIVAAPRTGALKNLVVFIRFSDETEFTDLVSTYDNMFNSATAGANSMYRYFKEASYDALTVTSTVYPIPPGSTVLSYQDSYTRAYYQPYNAVTNPIGYQGGDNGTERTDREHILLSNAINAINSQIPPDLNIDGDNDGRVDNVCFVVKGSPTGWASLLWPHMWALYTQNAYINGKQVYTYNFQLQTSLLPSNVGVLCHEMFHSLGSPDLYHYSYDGLQPTYEWDVMEMNMDPPQHMGAYMKMKYGTWISSIPEITTSGTYTLNPLTSASNNCYKIASPNSTTEFFVLEYRKKEGTFESSLPGEGLLVYRINSTLVGNAGGPPDEVYIYRPGGTTTTNGSPWYAAYSSNTGRTAINDATNPSSFLTSGLPGGLNISNVTSIGSTISFTVAPPEPPTYDGEILIWNPDPTPSSGTNMALLLTAAGKDVDIAYNLSAVPNLSGYNAIFVFLGIFPNNYALQETDASRIVSYLNGGGKLFMEGGDTWAFDPPTSLHPYFAIQGLSDGAGDLTNINGVSGTFTENMNFSYSGENSYIDRLGPLGPAFPIFVNPSIGYNTAIAYDQGTYRTIGTSFEFGGLNDGASPSTKTELMTAIMGFFGITVNPIIPPPTGLLALDSFDGLVPLYWSGPYSAPSPSQVMGDDPKTILNNEISSVGRKPGTNSTNYIKPDLSKIASVYTYNVYRSELPGGPYSLIASGLTQTSYQDSGVNNNQKYYYVVTTNLNGDSSIYSNEEVGYPKINSGPGSYRAHVFGPSTNPYPYGIAVDGDYLWLAEYNEMKIYKINKSTGAVVSSFSTSDVPTGLAFDGTNLWIAGLNTDQIYKTDVTGTILQTISVPTGPNSAYITGVAYENGHVWVSDRDNNRILDFDASTGSLISEYPEPTEVQSMSLGPRGLAYNPMNNTLVQVVTDFNRNPTRCYVYEFNLATKTFSGRKFIFERNYDIASDLFWSNGRGIAYDPSNNSYWITDVSQNIIYRVEPFGAISTTYTITISPTPVNGIIELIPAGGVYDSNEVVTVIPHATTNYHFASWGGDLAGSTNPEHLTMNGNKNVTANFAIDTYTITASAGANGSISPSGAVTVNYGADQSFTITANAHYHVADVLVDGGSIGAVTSHTFTAVGANHTIAASFTIDTYTITASAGANGTITPSGAVSVNYGSDQSFTIAADVNYRIGDVLVNGISVGAVPSYTFTNVTADQTIAASFALNVYTLTVNVVGNGTVIKDPEQPSYNHGTHVELEAVPDHGWTFSAWSGDAAGSVNLLDVTMDGIKNITATFILDPVYQAQYRSFDPDSIAKSKDLKLKHKYIARKANACEFEFELIAPQSVALTLKFSMLSTGVVMNGTNTVGSWTNGKTVTTTGTIDSLDTLTVIGWGFSGKPVKTGYVWATPKATKGTVVTYLKNYPRLPMPNRLNVLSETFMQAGADSFIIGQIKDSVKNYGWLQPAKWTDLDKSLVTSKGIENTADAHGFDFKKGTIKPILKANKSLPPDKFDNRLLANMIALKLNIMASALGKTPSGFGELTWKLFNPQPEPPRDMMVKEIAAYTDQLMMGWLRDSSYIKSGKTVTVKIHEFPNPYHFAYVDSVISLINNAFEGQLDTLYFADSLQFTGVKKLIDVSYLKGNSSVVPAKIIPDYTKLEQIPEAYKLHQNYPNPFNPTTMIQFDIPQEAFVTLKVYNLLGQEVATLINNELLTEGTQEVEFNASSFASGVYYYRIVAESIDWENENVNSVNSVKKMILMK
ncbi:MAG: M6 family metalloprotease domain-containing protein [Ignavibacteriales bacterium]|nr:M6 family metalloprotease domain-containing protein [Ignavibacteriales bacterium]